MRNHFAMPGKMARAPRRYRHAAVGALLVTLALGIACVARAAVCVVPPATAACDTEQRGLAKRFGAAMRIDNPDGNGDTWENLGSAVALSGDVAVVGSPRRIIDGLGRQGAAFVFERFSAKGPWALRATLLASDQAAESGAAFGTSVAIAGDVILVGAPGKHVGSMAGQGAAYVFRRSASGSEWDEVTRLIANDGAAFDQFGTAVAIGNGRFAVSAVGSDAGAIADRGAVYVFLDDAAFTQDAKLVANDASAGDQFGTSLAQSGNTVLIGVPNDVIGANVAQGSAYVFVRSGSARGDTPLWAQQAKLVASDGAAQDRFGVAVAIDADTALVGSSGDDIGTHVDRGSGYVFGRSVVTWSLRTKLVDADGTPTDRSNEFAGGSVALSPTTAVLGAVGAANGAGRAFVFVRSGVSWTTQARLAAAGGEANERFGYPVALFGDALLVGAPRDRVGEDAEQGTVRTYMRFGTLWAEESTLAVDAAIDDWFGYSLSMSGDQAMTGAPLDAVDGQLLHGSAYALQHGADGWETAGRIVAPDSDAGDGFGFSIAMEGDAALIGAPGVDAGAGNLQGAAYVFAHDGGKWAHQQRLVGSASNGGDRFGHSLALSGNLALIGAPRATVAGLRTGSVYVFERNGSLWTEQSPLVATDAALGDEYGGAIALEGNTALIGAVGADAGQGAVYVRERGGTSWSEQRLVASDAATGDRFGTRIAIAQDLALIGAVGANAGRGAVYVFARGASGFTEQGKLTVIDGVPGDRFGISLALRGSIALIAAQSDDSDRDVVYRYERINNIWSETQRLRREASASGAALGSAIALGDGTALVGAYLFSGAPPDGRTWAGAVYAFEELSDRFFADGFESP